MGWGVGGNGQRNFCPKVVGVVFRVEGKGVVMEGGSGKGGKG